MGIGVGLNTFGPSFCAARVQMRRSCSFGGFCLAVEHILAVSDLNLFFWMKFIREIELLNRLKKNRGHLIISNSVFVERSCNVK